MIQAVSSQPVILSIITQYLLEWQAAHAERGECLDAAWARLQPLEASLRRTLGQDCTAQEYELLSSLLDRICQRMAEIELELERGPNWSINGYGGKYDE